jgi:hypothetical protein
MWKLVLGIVLSLLPKRWRDGPGLQQVIPWERATIVSGILESLLALGALVAWYSHSVSSWAAEALDSALRGGPPAAYSGQELGLSAFVLWLLHPQTWLMGYFSFEGMVRMLAAISTEQTVGTLPLVFWIGVMAKRRVGRCKAMICWCRAGKRNGGLLCPH